MKKINYRDCSLASHLIGNRGAGRHETAHSHYISEKHGYATDSDCLTEEEICDGIIKIIERRVSLGLRKHFVSNFIRLGERSDVLVCLGLLVKSGRITAFDSYACATCGLASDVKRDNDSGHSQLCCDSPSWTSVSEFYSA